MTALPLGADNGGGFAGHLDLAADESLSLRQFGHWDGADAWPDSSMSPTTASGDLDVPSDTYDSSPVSVSEVGEQAALLNSAVDPSLPLLEDELLAELTDFSLHAWFDDFGGEIPPLLIVPQPVLLSAAPATSSAPTAADTTTAAAVSPVEEETSPADPTSTFLVSGSFAAVSTETATEPVIASMTLTRDTDWKGDGGTATVAVEVNNGTGVATPEGYWVTFFVDRGVEGITIPEPTHAVPALAPGETTDVPTVATNVVVAAGAEPGLYHLRAALVTNPNAPPREAAPLLVKAAGDLSVEWSRVDVTDSGGTIQTMGGGGGGMGGGGVPHVDEVYLTPSSIWTESGGTSQASANVCNNSGEPMGQQPQYTVTFSEDGDDISIPAGQETHDVPQLDDGACALVPLWDGVDVVVAPGAAPATYQVTATLSEGAGSKSAPLYVVEVTDWKVEWENPPGSDTWVVPTDQTANGTPYVWSHDTTRWTALGINPKDPPAVTRIDWEASSGGGDPVPFASVTCDCPAVGSPGPGKWDINPIVYFEGGTIAWGPSKQIVVAKINNVEWKPATGPEAGVLDETGGEIVFFPDAAGLGGGYRFLVRVEADVTPSGVAGIKVQFKAYDVDDPSDYNGPIDDDRDDDNVGGPDNLLGGMGSLAQAVSQTDANGIALNQFTATKRPGDNYRVAVAGRQSELSPLKPYEPYDSVNTDPQHPELLPSADTSLFADRNDDNVRQANEPLLNEDNAGDGVHVTRMLTVWRKLYVEIDLMKAPPPGQVYPDDGEPVDMPPDLNAAGTALREPDDGLLQEAYGPAFIKIESFAPNNTQITNQFKYVLVDEFDIDDPFAPEPQELPDQGEPFRDSVPESDAYWTVYIQSAYEIAHNLDNDGDEEESALGYTTKDEPEYSFIFLETIRDRVASALDPPVDPLLAEKRVVAHEIGHHFLGLIHVNGSLMAKKIENATSNFTEQQIKGIRTKDKP